jgi:hypothetical protein
MDLDQRPKEQLPTQPQPLGRIVVTDGPLRFPELPPWFGQGPESLLVSADLGAGISFQLRSGLLGPISRTFLMSPVSTLARW